MTRWRSSRLLFMVSVLIFHVTTQVSATTAAAEDPVGLIPIFKGIASSKTTQAIAGGANAGGANGKGGWPDDFDPDNFSPDDPKSPSGAAQSPEAEVSSTTTASSTTTSAAANTNTTTTGTTTSTTANAGTTPAPAPTPLVCPQGQVQVSVESAGVFCVQGPRICSGSMNDGNCPGPDARNGLPEGSYCGIVGSGVYGCKRNPTPAV